MDTSRQPGAHPLEPLTADEVREVAAMLRRDRGVEPPRWRFASIELVEPPKATPQETSDRSPPRQAQAVCWNREDGRAYRGLVTLADGAVSGSSGCAHRRSDVPTDRLRLAAGRSGYCALAAACARGNADPCARPAKANIAAEAPSSTRDTRSRTTIRPCPRSRRSPFQAR